MATTHRIIAIRLPLIISLIAVVSFKLGVQLNLVLPV